MKLTFFSLLLLSFITCSAGYFQQDVKYTIHVTLDDKKDILSAHISILYKNNSPVTLNELYFHIWPAAYKDRYTFLAREFFKHGDNKFLKANESDFGDIDSLDYSVNNEKVKWNVLTDTSDICKIILNNPLNPGDSILIATPFRVKIPSASLSRLGHENDAYYITQWFPKPAVFDSNGWNYFFYLDKGEYYSEFGSFDVYITLPENYLLAATGVMVNAENETKWLDNQDSITRAIKEFPKTDSFPASSKTFKTIHFHQEKVHDFAWFADKRWHVLKDTISFGSGRKVESWSFFNNSNASNWIKSPKYMRDAIHYYSNLLGEYPFEKVTAVDVGNAAGGGMEYPMITAIDNVRTPVSFETVLVHELGHNWFYGILGSNERCHPWMDEGVNKFYETRYLSAKYKSDSLQQNAYLVYPIHKYRRIVKRINTSKRQYYAYLSGARMNTDQSPDICSNKISHRNYQADVYYKTSLSFEYLRSYLGDSIFDMSMKSYYEKWKYKHPAPSDMKIILENGSGKNLDWLFDGLVGSSGKIDYKISSINKIDTDHVSLKLKNISNVAGPVEVDELKADKIISSKWIEGFTAKANLQIEYHGGDKFRIDADEHMPDIYRKNNTIKTSGIFKKSKPIKFVFATELENSTASPIYYSPAAGWNNYNGIMAGAVFHNISYLEKKFEYRLLPMYAFASKDFAGGGDISYHIYPRNELYRITLRSGISRYAFGDDSYPADDPVYTSKLHFTKIDSRIILSFKQRDPQEKINNDITLRSIYIERSIPYSIYYMKAEESMFFFQVEYKRENINPLNRTLNRLEITGSSDFYKISGELKHFFNYNSAKKGFNIRLYAGYLDVKKNSIPGVDYRMNLSGKDGGDDYLFDEVFLGRTETTGLLSHQFVSDYAGFKSPTFFYRLAEQWMAGLNMSTSLPGPLPIELFANIGSFDNIKNEDQYGILSWELGIDLQVIKDIFVIYMPLAFSKDIKYINENEELSFGDRIRFELHLNILNPLDMIKNVNR